MRLLQVIDAMTSIGVSVFVASQKSKVVEVYHAETHEQLSIINLEKSIQAWTKYFNRTETQGPSSKLRVSDNNKISTLESYGNSLP